MSDRDQHPRRGMRSRNSGDAMTGPLSSADTLRVNPLVGVHFPDDHQRQNEINHFEHFIRTRNFRQLRLTFIRNRTIKFVIASI